MNTSQRFKPQKIGKDKAIALFHSGWWEGRPAKEVAKFQLFTEELSMPFDLFHKALEESLGRPVFTHELALNFDGLCLELIGEKDAPTMEEIMDLIPAEKRIIITTT